MAADAESGAGDQLDLPAAAVEASESECVEEVTEKLEEFVSKLNPLAKEFFPAAAAAAGDGDGGRKHVDGRSSYNNGYNRDASGDGSFKSLHYRRRRNGYYNGRRTSNERIMRTEIEDCIRRTVYVADIDQHVTEQELANVFKRCRRINDCRVCGDPHSALRFAFIEFVEEYAANYALSFGGTMLGFYPLRVLPSKTAILPVNPTFLPKTEDEKDKCSRTVYCTNIDKKVTHVELRFLFESTCGEVSHLRLLGDNAHSTRIAFVEFFQAESAIIALSCSGFVVGALPIRVSPSKTPVKPNTNRYTKEEEEEEEEEEERRRMMRELKLWAGECEGIGRVDE